MKDVYISSTYTDLEDHRSKVYKQLREMGYNPHAMEDYTATEQRPLARCLADVAKCDVYIAIIAWRYGYVPKDDPNNERSITELEYEEAGTRRIPRLVFLLDVKHSWSLPHTDSHTGEGNGGQAIREFRDRLQKTHITGFYTTPDNLANRVSAAITNWEKDPHSFLPSLPPKDRREQVIAETTVLLGALSVDRRQAIAASFTFDAAVQARDLATHVVDEVAVIDVLPRLIRLIREASRADARRIAEMVSLLLPFNYIREAVSALREQIAGGGFGLVEEEVSTRSLAEILMAGYEQKATQFHVVRTGALRGEASEDYGQGPPVGPGNNSAAVDGARYAVRETLVHLLTVLEAAPQHTGASDVEKDIRDYARRLQDVLSVRQSLNRHERRTYFVLQFPDDPYERGLLKMVLEEVSCEAPGLFFIELAQHPKHDDETRVDHFLFQMMQHIHPRDEP